MAEEINKEELKQKVIEYLQKKPWQVRDLAKILRVKKKELDKIVQELINEGKAAYWSSGSTTYITTPEKLKEMEEKRSGI
ncbi:dissimilatory sulfite reductase D family protein [Archaeoglobus profundus]|uniref:Dissimilatory sulfite reductase D n=2 Tax=Archaeoglobus profundus TaxID=84156 RepID=D2RFY8_ARCPA|nr:dissimilatory sulfite reductase D family protein [Archaeoglobus profundus]AAC78311.1 DsrD [Archaeoglobus profundus DSM 5631]ADB57213.1 Dissimilatory sulfite reductase D [Archaeoglobus profundus DSM 5631]